MREKDEMRETERDRERRLNVYVPQTQPAVHSTFRWARERRERER
jgi:hypothetical protein